MPWTGSANTGSKNPKGEKGEDTHFVTSTPESSDRSLLNQPPSCPSLHYAEDTPGAPTASRGGGRVVLSISFLSSLLT
ncbi:hypothetical protein CEXT_484001 [Caerostris extrusa]|uniref:Uncharacterized protein n=1 Tax=Caerostris extrusa TaxID=172846 RepID=A0AAV4PJS2_CAEEX|nr:hypothetical protein CEXT_484001 [Caerostris extrusa]